MKKNLLKASKNVHCIGIGGIGLSGLAGILIKQNKLISGSDKEKSAVTDFLQKQGAEIKIGHSPKNIPKNTDLVIYSLAITSSNPEIRQARRLNIPVISYPQAVGELTKNFYTIAICGTHGKSTITAMTAKTLIENNFDPTVIVGTKLKELSGMNFRAGKSKILVLEACEYMRAFLNYHPRAIILHTLDPDHLDYYRDFSDYMEAFRQFARRLPSDGYFFGNLDDEDVHKILQSLQEEKFPAYNIFTYSENYPSSDFFLSGNKIIQKNARVGDLHMKIPGHHNRTNALSAFALCSILGIAPNGILRSLNNYEGAYRRFEIKGKTGKTIVIDDYAHHPEEIKATLQAAREKFPDKKICVVFQPHQYSRTKKLFKLFTESFCEADFVIIPDIFEARDSKKDKSSITAEHFAKEIQKHHKKGTVIFGDGIPKTIDYIKKNLQKFDIVITMGAGDVWKISDKLIGLAAGIF